MTASFPTSVKSFTAVTDGVDYPEAVDINSLQEEVAAIETMLQPVSGNIFGKSIASIANNASATATPFTNLSGLMVVVYNGSAGFRRTGVFIIEAYGLGTTAIVSDVASVYSVTPADAGKVCVWYNGSNGIGIENKTGETISNISIVIIGRQT